MQMHQIIPPPNFPAIAMVQSTDDLCLINVLLTNTELP